MGRWQLRLHDIGFAQERRSCGLLVGDSELRCARFGDARREIVDLAAASTSPPEQVIESICFNG